MLFAVAIAHAKSNQSNRCERDACTLDLGGSHWLLNKHFRVIGRDGAIKVMTYSCRACMRPAGSAVRQLCNKIRVSSNSAEPPPATQRQYPAKSSLTAWLTCTTYGEQHRRRGVDGWWSVGSSGACDVAGATHRASVCSA